MENYAKEYKAPQEITIVLIKNNYWESTILFNYDIISMLFNLEFFVINLPISFGHFFNELMLIMGFINKKRIDKI